MNNVNRIIVLSLAAVAFMTDVVVAQAKIDTAKVYNINEVVVTGTNNAVCRNHLPYTVSVLNKQQIEAAGPSQLLSAVSVQVPSLFVSERNFYGFGVSTGGSGGIKIRGVGGSPTNSVLMMVDGQPQFAGIYSHHVADFYESDYVDHVEVLRGPGSVLYGSNAMGGVINVITRNAGEQGARFSKTTQYGSYNTWMNSLNATLRYGKFTSLVSIGHNKTDGVKKGFKFKQGNLYAKVGYEISDNWKVNADYSFMKFDGKDPIYPRLSNPESTDVYVQDVIRGESSLSLTNNYGSLNGCMRVYYSYGNHYVDDPKHFHSLDDRFGILTYQNFSPWKNASATIGFDFDTYTGEIPMSGGIAHQEGSKTTIGRKEITEYSPYVTMAQDLFGGVLNLNAGIRMANSNRFDTQWVPQGGIVVRPYDQWVVRASLAKGYRNPSFRELYLYKTANTELAPENMMNYEVCVGNTFSRYFKFDVTGYYSKGSNLIQTENMKNVNTGNFINKGFEVTASSHPLNSLFLRTSYSYLHTSLSNLTAAPRNQYFLGIGWQALSRLHFDAEMRGVGDLYVANDVANQNYVLFNLKASYHIDFRRGTDVFVKLDNITDKKYVINKGYDMPGITAIMGFKVDF